MFAAMKNIFFFFLCALLLSVGTVSCSESNSSKSIETDHSAEKTAKKEQKILTKKAAKTPKKVEKKRKYPKINNENVSSFLSQYGKENPENKVRIKTKYGNIDILLYEDTPLHRANFIYLTKQNFFKNTQFYRVSENFVVQGGDSDDFAFQDVKKDIGTYRIPNEIQPHHLHEFGAVAMAREYKNNEEKKSSSFEFYIVIGEKHKKTKLTAIAREYQMTFTDHQMEVYSTVGGTPHLDGQHTVFGKVISGMDVAREISNLETDSRDWPFETIQLNVELIQ